MQSLTFCVFALMVGALFGCTTQLGQEFATENVSSIRSGVTTKQMAVSYLGEPLRRNIATDGNETWHYVYRRSSASPRAVAFIPGVGPGLPNAYNTSSDYRDLIISFSGDVVSSCKLTVTSTQGKSADAMAQAASTVTQTTNCGDTPSTANSVIPE